MTEQATFDLGRKEGLEKKITKISGEYVPGRDFYIPKHKYELVDWLEKYCDRTGKKPRPFSRMNKKQLYAIYFSIRKAEG